MIDPRRLTLAAALPQLDGAVLDIDRIEHDLADRDRQVETVGTDALPRALAELVGFQADDRLVEDDGPRLDDAAQQRRQREDRIQLLDLGEGALELAVFVGDAHAAQVEMRDRQDRQIDLAFDVDRAADKLRRLRFELRLIFVPVDDIGQCEERGEYGQYDRCECGKDRTQRHLQPFRQKYGRSTVQARNNKATLRQSNDLTRV